MKNTTITEEHINQGAKMVEFAGFNMPLKYTGVSEEHHMVRKHVGLFDVSHMGEFFIEGPQALDLVQYVTSNNAARLRQGQAQYSCFPNHEGGIVDDLITYRLHDRDGLQRYMLVVNGANITKDYQWIKEQNRFDAQVIDRSDDISLFALQGPQATQLLKELTDYPIENIAFYHFAIGEVSGLDNVLISATGYTGSGGYELYIKNEDALKLWKSISSKLHAFEGGFAGLGARDTLRLEMGYCLYGNDIDDHTSPIEAGLGWITKTKKGAFVGLEQIRSVKADPKKKLVGFVLDGRRIPRHGYQIVDDQDQSIGRVTSGTNSPSLNIPIGMGYVRIDQAEVDNKIYILAGKKKLEARIVKTPFVAV